MTPLLALGLVTGGIWVFGIAAPLILLRLHHATSVSHDQAPVAYLFLAELARKARIRPPALSVIRGFQPNAFSVGRAGRSTVVVTEGVFDRLSLGELRALLAREVAHVAMDRVGRRSFVSALAWLVSFVQGSHLQVFTRSEPSVLEEPRFARGGVFFPFWAPLALVVIRAGLSQRHHLGADELAASLLRDAGCLRETLEHLDRESRLPLPSWAPATASLFAVSPFGQRAGNLEAFATQPSLERRLAHLEKLPVTE